jgi:hypothetical protein
LASNTASHNVTVTVSAINEIAITGGSITLTINSASAGSNPNNATNNTCTMDWTTNENLKKITVETDQASPNFTLRVQATGVTGTGSAAGNITITNSPADFVTGVATTTGGCTLNYTASATAGQGTGTVLHVITYTITGA